VSIVSTTAGATPSVIFIPQLLNPIDESEVEQYLKDDRWGAEEKFDGRHQTIHMVKGVMKVANRKGKEIGYPKAWSRDIQIDVVLDGETIGDRFYAFDLLSLGDEDYRGRGYEERWEQLYRMGYRGSIEVVSLAIGYTAKKALYDRLVKEGREGIVFKRLDGKYCPGKNHMDMFKHKFYSTASVVVLKHNQKNSIEMGLLDESGAMVSVGNVTLIGHDKPPVNSVCECRYLYAYRGGSLYQPTYLGPRDDIDVSECTLSQLKYKSEEAI
jgi:bifunctional non-homologous end joining protein LigD